MAGTGRAAHGGIEEEVVAAVPGLYRYARSLVGDPATAEDLVGETVARALERQGSYRGEAAVATWLHRILFHLAVDRSRRVAREVSLDAVRRDWEDERYSVDASAVALRAAEADELVAALGQVPIAYRAVLVLHDAEGLPLPEVARRLEIGVPAAKQRLRRGRMMLVSVLAGEPVRRTTRPAGALSCARARSEVSDYIDSRLPDGERRLLEEHLAGCLTCPPLYAALVGVRDALGALRLDDAAVPAGLATRIRERMREGRAVP
jgi:RNA polymerase sigma-70 factor (ECF subfamily)